MNIPEQSNTIDDTNEINGTAVYICGLGFFLGFFILIIILYASYIYKRQIRSRLPPQTATNDTNYHNHHILKLARGLDDDVLVTFPTFVYSEFMMVRKGEGENAKDAVGSGCYICLSDYKSVDVIRLLPECGHLFHVRCVDTWLKVHPTCPVCRRSLIEEILSL